jgi:dipeptidyl-peptidase-4
VAVASDAVSSSDSFPRQHARTQRFSLGVPRNLSVTASGRVVFLRSRGGEDPTNCMWVLDADADHERLVVDPLVLLSEGDGGLPAAERTRRERAREGAAGVVSYALDAAGERASFALSGQAFVVELSSAAVTRLDAAEAVFDPRLDPTGQSVAYVSGDELRVVGAPGASGESATRPDRLLASSAEPEVSWGSAEFIAAEEMRRSRGFWWSPEGDRLVVARVDVSPIQRWYITDPAHPDRTPTEIRYPAAGTSDADVTLHIIPMGDGGVAEPAAPSVPVQWDRELLPYVVDVTWTAAAGLRVVAQTRDQRRIDLLNIDPATGEVTDTRTITEQHWVEVIPGTPRIVGSELVSIEEHGNNRALLVDGVAVSSPEHWVRSLVDASPGRLIYTASADPTQVHVFVASRAEPTPGWDVTQVTGEAGVHGATGEGSTLILQSSTLTNPGITTVLRGDPMAPAASIEIPSFAATPLLTPRVQLHEIGERRIATAVLFPSPGTAAAAADGPLPVLLDPYGGPHAQRVLASRNAFLASQWFADQGFVVIIADGRGTPGRGEGWERAVRGDVAQPVLDDQVAALDGVAELYPGELDLNRVAIRGWSFGGYLAALAVLRRPDRFHAAVAGAPVTDWRLYDTHYTERYLGHPDEEPENYERTSLLNEAHLLESPLMLIHGLADDNVVAAHTLQLSTALLAAGRPHEVLPLSGVTHMTPQEEVAENLLLLQVEFLRRSLR